MHKYLLLFCCTYSATIILFSSCKPNVTRGSGKEITDTRNVSSFSAISIDVPLDASITVKEGAQASVQLYGYQNLLQQIKTEIKNGTLYISVPDGWHFYTGKDITATITVPTLTALAIDGDASADLHGNISGANFNLDISGAGKVTVDNINVAHFVTSVSGAGSITIKAGNATHAEYDISGAGDLKAFPLQTTETEATVSGTGTMYVNVQHKLDAHVSGTGSIRYKGHPDLTSDVSGIGAVDDAN